MVALRGLYPRNQLMDQWTVCSAYSHQRLEALAKTSSGLPGRSCPLPMEGCIHAMPSADTHKEYLHCHVLARQLAWLSV
jgi:hypothetical protein